MKRLVAVIAMIMCLTTFCQTAHAQQKKTVQDSTEMAVPDSTALAVPDSAALAAMASEADADALLEEMGDENSGFHKQLKKKFIEGNAGFMSLVALALVLGLAFCIERIVFLTLSEVNARKLMDDVKKKLAEGDADGARRLCQQTPGVVANVCYQGLLHVDEPVENVERSLANHGSLQSARLEKGCSWIKLCIAIAPSLGFLGTVIGMVMAFDHIQSAGDIGPTIVAEGMKVALITTIFGIIVALVLQVFYNYILTKIDNMTSQMEASAIELLDAVMKYKQQKNG